MTERSRTTRFEPRTNLRRARMRRGWSETEVAKKLYQLGIEHDVEEELGVDARTVSRWELGKARPNQTYTALLSLLYELPPEQLDLPRLVLPVAQPKATESVDATTLATDFGSQFTPTANDPYELLRRRFLEHLIAVAGSGAVTEASRSGATVMNPALTVAFRSAKYKAHTDRRLLEDLSALTVTYGGLRDVVSPTALLRPVTGHLDLLLTTLTRSPSSPGTDRARVATAQTAIIAGWLMFNIGQSGQALAQWVLAHELATEAGHSDLIAYALGCRSRLHSRVHLGDRSVTPAVSLSLLDHAVSLATKSTDPALRSWLLANRAEQHADAGAPDACLRDLDEALTALERPGSPDAVLWANWNSTRLRTYQGNCARLLHKTAEAIDILEDVLNRVDPRVIPARTNPLTDLAVAYAERREVERACDLLASAFAAAHAAGYPEGIDRIYSARRTVLGQFTTVPAVQRLDEILSEDC